MQKPHLKPKTVDFTTADSFQNFIARVGFGTGSQADASTYGFNPLTRNRTKLEWMYRGSWVVGKVVDAIAEDMTRAGVDITNDDDPNRIREVEEHATELQIWPNLCQTAKWARLYGGAVGYLMIDGQDPSTPLRIESIGKGQFRGVLPVDRWQLQPSFNTFVTEFGPYFGQPKFYEPMPANYGMALPTTPVHYSRIVRMEGVKLPQNQRISENLWGMSVVERMFDRLIAFDSTTQGAAQLVYKAYLRTMKIKGLREIIAAGGDALEGLRQQINMTRLYQSNEGISLMDLEDEFETAQYTFSGLDDVLLQFGQQLGGATDIPLVRLFAQSPAGMNATGESDWRNYYDGINNRQETELRPDIKKIYDLVYASRTGNTTPEGTHLGFKSLWKMTDEQKATVTNTTTAAIVAAHQDQIISRSTALKELKQLATLTGAFSNITDEEITEAENDPAPSAEALGLELPAPNVGPQGNPGTGTSEDR